MKRPHALKVELDAPKTLHDNRDAQLKPRHFCCASLGQLFLAQIWHQPEGLMLPSTKLHAHRLVCQWLSEHLGRAFVLDDKPGAAAISPPRSSPRRLPTATRYCGARRQRH
jgi:hypothetical protein